MCFPQSFILIPDARHQISDSSPRMADTCMCILMHIHIQTSDDRLRGIRSEGLGCVFSSVLYPDTRCQTSDGRIQTADGRCVYVYTGIGCQISDI